MSWSKDIEVYRVIFLVGDAPPHMDYQDDIKYPVTSSLATKRGIVINAVQCGSQSGSQPVWLQISRLAGGDFFRVDQDGSAFATATPYDRDLAELSAKLDGTRIYYGRREMQEQAKLRKGVGDTINKKATVAARARRTIFNSSAAGADNFYGKNELLYDLAENAVELSKIPDAELPEEMRAMTKDEQAKFVVARNRERASLAAQVEKLATKRKAHITAEAKKHAKVSKNAFSQKVYDAVRRQAKSIDFASEAAMH